MQSSCLAAVAQDEVVVQSGFSFALLMLAVPLVHSWAVVEALTFKAREYRRCANIALLAVFLCLTAAAAVAEHALELGLKKRGYLFCASESKSLTFSEIKVFVREEGACDS